MNCLERVVFEKNQLFGLQFILQYIPTQVVVGRKPMCNTDDKRQFLSSQSEHSDFETLNNNKGVFFFENNLLSPFEDPLRV